MNEAYVKRLEDAVRNAHKAMSLLKNEITELKKENDMLKVKLSLSQSTLEEAKLEEDESILDNTMDIVAEKPLTITETSVSDLICEKDTIESAPSTIGWTKSPELFSLRHIKDEPVKKWNINVKSLLSLATLNNYHVCAFELSKYPNRLVGRAIVDHIISSSVQLLSTTDQIDIENIFLRFTELMDIIIAVCQSIATLTDGGLQKLIDIWNIVRNTLLADIRNTNCNALYSMLTGDYSKPGVINISFTLPKPEEVAPSLSTQTTMTTDEDRKSELAQLFNFEDDSGSEESDGEANQMGIVDEHMVIPLDFRDAVADCNDIVVDLQEDVSIDATLMDDSNVDNSSPSDGVKNKLLGGKDHLSLLQSGKIYMLLVLCWKLNMKKSLTQLLRDLALYTSVNQVCHIGVMNAFHILLANVGIKRFIAQSLDNVQYLISILNNCVKWSDDNRIERHSYTEITTLLTLPSINDSENNIETLLNFKRSGVWSSLHQLSTSKLPNVISILDMLGFNMIDIQCNHILRLLKTYSSLEFSNGTEASEMSVGFVDLFQSSCFNCIKVGGTLDTSTANEETKAMDYFQKHWTNLLSDKSVSNFNNLKEAFHVFHCLITSLFATEYEVSNFGWKTGAVGFGMSMKEKLLNRLELGYSAVKKNVDLYKFFNSNSSNDKLPTRINWLKCSSVTSEELVKGGDFLDRCLRFFQLHDVSTMTSKELVNITELCGEISSIIALIAFERVIFMSVCSAQAFLKVIQSSLEENNEIVSSVQQCIKFLNDMPSPFGGTGNIAQIFDIMACENTISTMLSTSLTIVPTAIRLLRKCPAFVINLDRRPDRWRKTLQLCETCGILPLRVSAVDNLNSVHSPIPVSDVTLTWDSTENAQFDSHCMVNTAVPLTESERACAASHLSIWRAIASICGIKNRGTLGSASSHKVNDDVLNQSKFIYSSIKLNSNRLSPKLDNITVFDASLDYFVIFEDDAHVNGTIVSNFRCELSDLLSRLPTDADILYLGGALPKGVPKFKSSVLYNRFQKVNYVWQLHGYVLKKSAVNILLSNLPINAPVDNFVASLIFNGLLNAYVVRNSFVTQSGGNMKNRGYDSNIKHSGRFKLNERIIHSNDHDRDSKRSRIE